MRRHGRGGGGGEEAAALEEDEHGSRSVMEGPVAVKEGGVQEKAAPGLADQ
jgi:hypothetical protein